MTSGHFSMGLSFPIFERRDTDLIKMSASPSSSDGHGSVCIVWAGVSPSSHLHTLSL